MSCPHVNNIFNQSFSYVYKYKQQDSCSLPTNTLTSRQYMQIFCVKFFLEYMRSSGRCDSMQEQSGFWVGVRACSIMLQRVCVRNFSVMDVRYSQHTQVGWFISGLVALASRIFRPFWAHCAYLNALTKGPLKTYSYVYG